MDIDELKNQVTVNDTKDMIELTCDLKDKLKMSFVPLKKDDDKKDEEGSGSRAGGKKQMEGNRGVDEDIRKVRIFLEMLLCDAENRQLKDHTVKLQLDQLKHFGHEADDMLLDEWNAKLIKSKVKEERKEAAETTPGLQEKVRTPFHPLPFILFPSS